MPIAILFAAAACAGTSACAPMPEPEPLVSACSATDGDTLRCGEERIRLLGIDAPEMPGHCREGRSCAPGDPDAAKRALAASIAGQALTIRRFGEDRYGRTLGAVSTPDADLSCIQLAGGHAIYVARWDTRHVIARDCPKLAGGG